MIHQKIVRDYMNIYTPYRGLLLYHGLGAGKTCASIAIAEGMKENKEVIIMTPASLRMNYISELKHCGDPLYKTNQYWEKINTKGNKHHEQALSEILGLTIDFIRKAKGAWMVDMKKASNFDALTPEEQQSINKQINQMILKKYKFLNYNGMRKSHLTDLIEISTQEHGTSNPFDNKIIIIDEAHNFVSRIVNKLGKNNKSLSVRLYELILNAHNCKIVFLTGTPIINFPNEIAILFNMLRGYIKTFVLPIDTSDTTKTINQAKMGLNLSRTNSVKYYTSNRISSLIGNGLMTFIDKKTQLNDFFSNDEVVFYRNISELSDQLNYFKKNNELRKKIARRGQLKYFKYFDNKIVSKYIINKVFDIDTKNELKWMNC